MRLSSPRRPWIHCRPGALARVPGSRRARRRSARTRCRAPPGRSRIIAVDMADPRRNEDGRAALVLLVLLVLLLIVPGGCAAIRMLDRTAPTVTLKSDAKAIGKSARITIEADEPKWGVRELRATFVQGGVEVPLGEVTQPHNSMLRFWRKREI